jgi:tetratricopeptide (TPR) repeat protein
MLVLFGHACWVAGEDGPAKGTQESMARRLAHDIKSRIKRKAGIAPESLRPALALHAGERAAAESVFEKLHQDKREDAYARLCYSNAMSEAGDRAVSSGVLEKLLRDNPQSVTVLYKLGVLVLHGDRGEDGRALLERALKIDPFFSPANYALARSLATIGKREEAVEYAGRVLAVEDPGSPLAEKALVLLDKLIPENDP